MQAVRLDGAGGLCIDIVPAPVPGPTDVIVAPLASGVCGTDLHLRDGTFALARYPLTPGHEFSGRITRIGSHVEGLHEGDLVCVDPNVTCGQCRWCRAGAPNHCPGLDPIGLTRDGSCAELVRVPERVVHPLPDGVDPAIGALVEPLSCVLHATRRTPGWADARVAVLGAGPIGLLAVALSVRLEAATVTAFEPHPLRRELAAQLGAAETHPDAAAPDAPDGFDIAVEATGRVAVVRRAIELLGPGGRLLQMGVADPADVVEVSPYEVFRKELTIIGSFSMGDAYPAAVALAPRLAPVLRPLVTDRVPLSRYRDALGLLGSPTSIKVHLVPG